MVIGEKCKISDNKTVVLKCFERAKLTFSDEKHGPYLGKLGELIALFQNDTGLLKMDSDGTELKVALGCVTREGVSNLIRKGSGELPPDQASKLESEMKKQMKKLAKDLPQSDSSSESSESSDTSEEERRRKSRKKKKKKKKKRRKSDPDPKWRVGDKVMAKFRNEMMQGTVTSVDTKKTPPYEVKLDKIGVTYQMHPHELEPCLSPQNIQQNEMHGFLTTLNLQKHLEELVEEGFESTADLKDATMDDLEAIGMKRGHARRLLSAVKTLNENPDMGYVEVNKTLQKRKSFQGHRQSLMNALHPNEINHLLNQNPDDGVGLGAVAPMGYQQEEQQALYPMAGGYQQAAFPSVHAQQAPAPIASPQGNDRSRTLSTSSQVSVWEEDGYLIIPFDKRPLGFGIMSPLFVGTMVSTITDEQLKKKGLGLGLPLLSINNFEVTQHGLESVANILSRVELPFTVTFGLQPYFKPGQKVMVSTNNKWYPATVMKMSKTTRKVTVKYDGNPFRFSNTEKIADYNRIKQPGNNFGDADDSDDDAEQAVSPAAAAYSAAPAIAAANAAAPQQQAVYQEEKQDNYNQEYTAAQVAQVAQASYGQNAVEEYQNQPYVDQQYYPQQQYYGANDGYAAPQQAYYDQGVQDGQYNAAYAQQAVNYQQPAAYAQQAPAENYSQQLNSNQAAAILAAASQQADPEQDD